MQSTSETTELLRISGLRFSYPEASWCMTIDDFHLSTGEIVAVIGPNGSGKTTFLRLAAGVLPSREGQVLLNGKNLRRLNRRQIACVLGYLPQNTSCEFDYRVAEIVALGRYPHLPAGGFLREDDRRVLADAMRLTEIDALKNRRISRLSGGERQRVFLASVLAQEPSVLLLDEPTSALDIHHQIRFYDILRDLAERGMAVSIVTHDINLASLYCRRILLFDRGGVVKEGPPEEVIQSEYLSGIYGKDILISTHPQSGKPVIFPADRGSVS